MSYHIDYNHACEKCGCRYIPFDTKEPCPKCGVVEAGRFDFIPEAAQLAHLNIQETGSYILALPEGGSLIDTVLVLLFQVLEHCRTEDSGRPFAEVSEEYLSKVDWAGQEYFPGHFQRMVILIRDELNYLEIPACKIENPECGGCS